MNRLNDAGKRTEEKILQIAAVVSEMTVKVTAEPVKTAEKNRP